MGRPWLDRAGPDDVLSLALDRGRGRVPPHLGALLLLDGAVPAETVRAHVAARALTVPRLATRLRPAPPGGGRPVWVPVAPADVEACVGVRTLEPDGAGDERLLAGAAELVLTPIDRSGPLWRAEVLADPTGRARALVVVAHHAMSDGLGGLAVLAALADGSPGVVALRRDPARPPSRREIVADAWRSRVGAWRMLPRRWRRLRSGVRSLRAGRRGGAERCSLLAPATGRRALHVARGDLATVHAAAGSAGATVNDLVVASVVGALAALLARRGEHVRELVVSVPVSARTAREADRLGNAVGAVPVRVPVDAGPAERVAALVGQHAVLRGTDPGSTASLLTPAFRGLAALGVLQAFLDRQHLVHTFVTNVRGPARPLSVAGARVREVVPVATNPGNVTVSFDVLSYAGQLVVTLVSDPGRVPEAAWLAEELERGLCAWTVTGGRPGPMPDPPGDVSPAARPRTRRRR
jgi:diacylglycerol O-acyltransferase